VSTPSICYFRQCNMYVNSTKDALLRRVSMDTMVTRTRHYVSLHIHFLALNLSIPCIFIPAYTIYLPTKCTLLNSTNVNCVSAACFGTFVPSLGITVSVLKNQILLHTCYLSAASLTVVKRKNTSVHVLKLNGYTMVKTLFIVK
jgi:hypothetical protein